jgi:hypothetical protein
LKLEPLARKVLLDLLVLQERQEQQVQQERKVVLDLQVLQEAQEHKEQLDRLELKEMWEQLDQLVPQDLQE